MEGHLTMKKHTTTNQNTVSVMGGGCVMRFDLGGMCGWDDFTSFGAVNEATKIKKIYQIVVLGGRRTTILHSNQPKIYGHYGGGIIRDALPDGEVRGVQSHQFQGDRVGRRLKMEIKQFALCTPFCVHCQ